LLPGLRLSHEEYRSLAEFRYLIRRFLEFSQTAARNGGLTARQHQALLAIKGFAGDSDPTVGELAERLLIQHHSAVELVDRLVEAGLIVRHQDPGDRRRVHLRLTPVAEERLAELSAIHFEELHRMRPELLEVLHRLGEEPKGLQSDTRDQENLAAQGCGDYVGPPSSGKAAEHGI